MNYAQCLEYLNHIQAQGIKLGLDNVRAILTSLNNPQNKYPSVLVAGSNGKGSVCAMLTRILSLHHCRVGLYTSPHLVKMEERIRVGEELISPSNFCRLLTFLREKIDQLIQQHKLVRPPTYFELMTCLAFLYFEKQKVDIAVLEVGMGGRFDATNVVNPLLSIITTISLEHKEFLGESFCKIALEKAGIIKPGIGVVSGVEEPSAYETLKRRAQEVNSPFFRVFQEKNKLKVKKEAQGYSFEYQTGEGEYRFSPSLLGEHQGKNACITIVAAEQLSRRWKRLEKEKIIQGLESTRWEGRLEIVSSSPLIILDGAHNEEGALALKKYVQDFLSLPLILVFAIMKNKEIEKVGNILFPLADHIILTKFSYHKAASPESIRERSLHFKERMSLEPDVSKAVQKARQMAGDKRAIILTGSLFLTGEYKKFFTSLLPAKLH